MVLAVGALLHQCFMPRVANRALWLVMLFPGAYVLALVYSEPLFVACAALCLLALGRAPDGGRRWWALAGLAAAVAGATRPTGIAVMICCAWVALREIRKRRDWSALIAPLLSPIG